MLLIVIAVVGSLYMGVQGLGHEPLPMLVAVTLFFMCMALLVAYGLALLIGSMAPRKWQLQYTKKLVPMRSLNPAEPEFLLNSGNGSLSYNEELESGGFKPATISSDNVTVFEEVGAEGKILVFKKLFANGLWNLFGLRHLEPCDIRKEIYIPPDSIRYHTR